MDPNDEIAIDSNGHCDLRYRGWDRLDERLFCGDVASRITSLDLSHNSLTELPKTIGFLSGLQELNVACNHIAKIDADGIAKLKQLRIFKVNGNSISSLPNSIGQCKRLEQLIASENKLAEVPASLADCSALRTVMLQHNDISQLPLDLHRLSDSIETLCVSGNTNLTMIPNSVRDNNSVIMWILSTHTKRRDEISRLHETADEAKERSEKCRAAVEELQKEVATLTDQKKCLEADIASVATYLKCRRRIRGYRAKIQETRETIRTMFELKADKVAALS